EVGDYFAFFFSSRRRHTRFSRDWSSDVCSSDLQPGKCQAEKIILQDRCLDRERKASEWPVLEQRVPQRIIDVIGAHKEDQHGARSEERRVGKETRARWGE